MPGPEDETFDIDPEALAAEAEKPTEDKPPQDPRLGLPPNVQVVEAAEPFQPTIDESLPDEGPWVEYTGIALIRIMGPDEWAAAHVDSENYFEWNHLNNKRISRHAFNDHELQYLLRVDGRFRLVES